MEGFEPWEPEETIGKIWHAWAAGFDAPEVSPEAAVSLEDEVGRLSVLFRGLGGAASVEIRPAARRLSDHRISLRRKLGTMAEEVDLATFDGEILRLPATMDVFPDPALNRGAYTWLAAMAAFSDTFPSPVEDPLQSDFAQIAATLRALRETRAACPAPKQRSRQPSVISLARPTLRPPFWRLQPLWKPATR